MADFDRTIPPGGEGHITLKVNLAGYHGRVRKGATVYSNDPKRPQLRLALEGTVQSLVNVKPRPSIFFSGTKNKITPQVLDLTATTDPFHIVKVETTLENKIAYQVITVEEGKHYQLKVENEADQGTYHGFLICRTDLAQKPVIKIQVRGRIEGKISVRPLNLYIGKVSPKRPVRNASVSVVNNMQTDFKITSLSFDKTLIDVEQTPVPNRKAYTLQIKPKLEGVPNGSQKKTRLAIETDVEPGKKLDVGIYVVNRSGSN